MTTPPGSTDRLMALDLPLPDPLPEAVAELFSKCQAKLGLIPNVLVAYAHRPEKLQAFSLMYNDLMLGPSGLSKLEREMIAVAVSAENRCWYCQVAHGAQLRQISGDPALGEALVMNWHAADLDPRQRAMIDFALRMTRESAAIGDAEREVLRGHGLSDTDIWDIAAVASFFNMSNRMASAVGMEPNPDYHAMAR
ncbi:MAG: peroxidase-related enzyme [Pseudomonadota bacterium]